jgi:hypothetical protein
MTADEYPSHEQRTAVVREPTPVDVVAHDVLPAVATGHHVVHGIRVVEPQASWHAPDSNIPTARLHGRTRN